MHKSKRNGKCLFRSPSPARVGGKSKSRLGPWTAQRARKKGKSNSPEGRSAFAANTPWPEPSGDEVRREESEDRNGHVHPSPHRAGPGGAKQLDATAAGWFAHPGQPHRRQLRSIENVRPDADRSAQLWQARPPAQGFSDVASAAVAQPTGTTSAPNLSRAVQGLFGSGRKEHICDETMECATQAAPSRARPVLGDSSTPSPSVPAPGIQPDACHCTPPDVPTSCKTVHRAFDESPRAPGSAARSSLRHSNGRRTKVRTMLTFDSDTEDDRLMAIDEQPCEEMSEQPSEGHPRGEAQETREGNISDGDSAWNTSDDGWLDTADGGFGQPASGAFRRSGAGAGPQGSSACQAGNELSVAQAWQRVRNGDLKPNDVDTLNSLLRSFCKVSCEPQEAEEVVKQACQDGSLLPNASTYHHMAKLWTRHEQLNN